MSELFMDRLILSIRDGVADVRLNRPDKLNALDPAMFVALTAMAKRLATESDVRAVVLSGEGRAFCSGLDVEAVKADPGAAANLLGGIDADGASRVQQAALAWRNLPAPVICAIKGAAVGGGLQIALGCDIRIVSPGAKLSFMEIKWGLIPDMAGIALVRGLVRDDHARELIWSGRLVEGAEAVALGLATRLADDPYAAAMVLAAEFAGKFPPAIAAGKRLLNLAADASRREILAAETEAQSALTKAVFG